METLAIHLDVLVAAPIERVWPFIGTAEGLSRWFNDAHVELDPTPGGHYFERGTHGGSSYIIAGHVLTYVPLRELSVSCRVETTPDSTWPVYTTMTLRVEAEGDSTRVSLVHSGFENLPESYRQAYFDGFTAGWGQSVPRLAEIVVADLA